MDDPILGNRCRNEFTSFVNTLSSMKELIPQMDSPGEADVVVFNEKLKESVRIYEELERLVCV